MGIAVFDFFFSNIVAGETSDKFRLSEQKSLRSRLYIYLNRDDFF